MFVCLENLNGSRALIQHELPEIEDRHERTGSVKFADQSDEGKESSLQRHNTPHPRELRTWRNKATKKFQQTDGNLLHHDHQHPFQPNSHSHRDTSAEDVHDTIEYIPPEISNNNHHRLSDDEHDERTGEEYQYIVKHVEFSDGLNDDEDKPKDQLTQKKLIRKNTPHHLKDKRILNRNNDPLAFDVSRKSESFSRFIEVNCW